MKILLPPSQPSYVIWIVLSSITILEQTSHILAINVCHFLEKD